MSLRNELKKFVTAVASVDFLNRPFVLHQPGGQLHCTNGPSIKYWNTATIETVEYFLHGICIHKTVFDKLTADNPDALALALRLIEELPNIWRHFDGDDKWKSIADMLKQGNHLLHMKKMVRKAKLSTESLDAVMLFLRHRNG